MNNLLSVEYEFYYYLARKLIGECDREEISEIAERYLNLWHRQNKFRSSSDRNLDGFLFCITLIRRDHELLEKIFAEFSGRSLLSVYSPAKPRRNQLTDYCPSLKDILLDMKEFGVTAKKIAPGKAPKNKNEIILSQNLDQQFKLLLDITFDLVRRSSNSKHRLKLARWVQNLVLVPKNAAVAEKLRRNDTLIFLAYILNEGKCDRMPKEWDFIWQLPRTATGRRESITNFKNDLKVPDHGVFVFLSFNHFGTP